MLGYARERPTACCTRRTFYLLVYSTSGVVRRVRCAAVRCAIPGTKDTAVLLVHYENCSSESAVPQD